MNQTLGVLMVMASSAIGGTSAALIRFMVGSTDPVTLSTLRFGMGGLALVLVAIGLGSPWPKGRDWLGVASLGVLFFGLCFGLYNWALSFTTAARGALAMSTLPLLTMLAAALLGIERLTLRKSVGVAIAIAGAAVALGSGLANAPAGAWKGDLIMIGAAVCYALYNVWSRPFIARSGALGYTAAGMAVGALSLLPIAALGDGVAALGGYGPSQWQAILYLGTVGSALSSYLWISALRLATPTRVAMTSALNPLTASALAAQILGEPIGPDLILGVIAVVAGIWMATSERPSRPGLSAEVGVAYRADPWNAGRAGERPRR